MTAQQALTALRSLRAAADRTLGRSIHDDERAALDVAIAALSDIDAAERELATCKDRLHVAERMLDGIARLAGTLISYCDFAEPFDGDEDERGDFAHADLSNGDVHRIWAACETLNLALERFEDAKAAHDTNPTPKTPPRTRQTPSEAISENDNNPENTI